MSHPMLLDIERRREEDRREEDKREEDRRKEEMIREEILRERLFAGGSPVSLSFCPLFV